MVIFYYIKNIVSCSLRMIQCFKYDKGRVNIILKIVKTSWPLLRLVMFSTDGSFRLLFSMIFKLPCSIFFIRVFRASDQPRTSDPLYVKICGGIIVL